MTTEKEFLQTCLEHRDLISKFLASLGHLGDRAFLIAVDAESNPDAVGEYLRSQFFATDPDDAWSIGCYSAFDWAEGVEPLPNLHVEESTCPSCRELEGKDLPLSAVAIMINSEHYHCACTYEADWTRGQRQFGIGMIECRYFWDGDGILAFHLPDGKWLVNTDCKKDHDWEIRESVEDF